MSTFPSQVPDFFAFLRQPRESAAFKRPLIRGALVKPNSTYRSQSPHLSPQTAPLRILAKIVISLPVLSRAVLILAIVLTPLAAEPGLVIRFSSPSALSASSALTTIPFASFHVPTNQPASLFLNPGPFTAEITGYISVDLRAQHTFTAELTGQAALFINGKELLNTSSTEKESTHTSTPVRLSKGTNALLIRYASPASAPATFRLLWSSRNTAVPIPIPSAALSHTVTPELTRSLSTHNGAFLFNQYQCVRCHSAAHEPVSPFDAPTFDGIGSRLHPDWITSWVLNPSHVRPTRMPKIFKGPDAEKHSRDVASFLATLTNETQSFQPTAELRESGAALVKDLNCRSCHAFPSEPAAADRISLAHVPKKFIPEALVAYLQNPQAHYRGNPMPNFKLSAGEAQSIAAFLVDNTSPSRPEMSPTAIAAGKNLVQKSGCLNCHAANLQNEFTAPAFAGLRHDEPHGCLQENATKAPHFSFTPAERADLLAFLAAKDSPIKISAAESALRYSNFLRCSQCHLDSSLPAPISLGGKLKPEWTARFIAGDILQKPRPWLKTRMPAFPAFATNLAAGLAALHGYPAATPAEPPPAPDLVATGATLIGSTAGFSCVACHAVGASSVQLIVESPGINLASSGERLLPAFFHRWLMNPLAIDPSTKMPAYFDAEGRSQLIEYFDGDAHKQVNAMWHYIRSLDSPK